LNHEADNQEETKKHGISAAGVDRLVEAVKWFILSEELIPKGSLVLAAVSGGQDSMAMLSILHRLSRDLDYRLAVAHFDHRLRTSSERDRAVVEQFAKSCSLEVIADSEDVRDIAKATGDNLEEAARKARYEFFFRSAKDLGASRIATGHTRDDRLETVVMRLLRGCGIRGLAGIPVRRGILIRPLLAVRRDETGSYCKACDIAVALDPSNQDTRYFRNRVRLEVLPFLRNIQPSVDDNLLRLSDNADRLIHSIRTRIRPLLKRHSRKLSDNEWKVNVTKLSDIDDTSLVVLFGDLFTEHMHLDMDFTQTHFEKLIHLARSASASGKMLSLPDLQVKREFENLIFTIEPAIISRPAPAPLPVTLKIPGRTAADGMTVVTEILDRGNPANGTFESTDNEAFFAMDRIAPPLVIRPTQPGDRIQPFGMRGSKKLSDILIDKKVPGRERSRLMVISDAKRILWLIGIATSEAGRIGQKTQKILKITLQPE
jgi:tRNA(Ile)-lysidine synthase